MCVVVVLKHGCFVVQLSASGADSHVLALPSHCMTNRSESTSMTHWCGVGLKLA